MPQANPTGPLGILGRLKSLLGLFKLSGVMYVVNRSGRIRLGTNNTEQTTHFLEIQADTSACNVTWLNSGGDMTIRGASGGNIASGGFRDATNNVWSYGTIARWAPTPANFDIGVGRTGPGVLEFNSGTANVGKTFRSVPLTPAQITANQDNYNPGVAMYYRLSSDAARDITGLSISQVDGQTCEFWNIGAQNIVLKHDVTSTAANRFYCVGSADLTLAPNGIALLRYDSTSTRWRVGIL